MGTLLGQLFQRSDDLLDYDIRNDEGKAILGDLKSGYLNSFGAYVCQGKSRQEIDLIVKSKNLEEPEQKLAAEFWEEVSKNIPEWQLLIEKKVSAYELRQEFVHAHTNLINALGLAGHVLVTQFPNDWKQKIKALQKFDWARDSPVWQGKLMIDGRMLKTRSGINKAANVILQACGVTKTLDDFEGEK